jgi:hypothetical protein
MALMRYMAVLFVLAILGPQAEADMAPPAWQTGDEAPRVPPACFHSPADGSVGVEGATQSESWPWSGVLAPAGTDQLPPAHQDEPPVMDLPGPPSSAVLCLWALGCLGATWAGRSAGQLHMSHAPMWFHSAAPARIGHVSLIQLDRNDLPVCRSDEPAGEHIIRRFAGCLTQPRLEVRDFLAAARPRGPPASF